MVERWQDIGRNTRILIISLLFWAFGEGLWLLSLQPLYLGEFGASPEETGAILSLSGLARLLTILPAGLLADRYGSRRLLLPGFFLGFIGVSLLAIAPNLYVAALGVAVYGASAMAVPIISLYIVQSIDYDDTVTNKRPAQDILTFVHGLYWGGIMIAPTVGGYIADLISLRAVFILSGIFFACSFTLVTRTGAYPVVDKEQRTLSDVMAGYRAVFRQPKLIAIYTIFVMGFFITVMGTALAPEFLEDVYGLSESEIGFLATVLAFGAFIWNINLGKGRPWRTFSLALFISSIGFGVLLSSSTYLVMMAAYFLLGTWDMLRPLANSIISETIPQEQHGLAFSINDTIHGVGVTLGPATAGILYGMRPELPFMVSIALTPVVILVIFWFAQRQSSSSPTLELVSE